MSPLHPSAGLRVGGRYLLSDLVAGGGMGEVWRAEDQVLGRVVAVKLLRREYAADDAFLSRFRAEARHAASLGHPGIAQVFDYGEDDGTAYLVMELVPGEPLSARLQREGALPAAVAVPLLQQAARALDAAHATGLVHRDVKPGNLLITPDERVKITDFGIARAGDQAPLTRTGEVMGTAQYLSPEQAMGRTATPASDVYSLGIVAYEMLRGRRPFEADTAVAIALAQVNNAPEPLPASVPAPVAATVLQALAKDPAERPASAAAFADSLGDALRGVPPTLGALAVAGAATTVLPPVPPSDLPPVALPADPVTPVTGTAGAAQAPEVAQEARPGGRSGRAVLGVALLLLLVLGTAVAVALTRGGGTPVDPARSTTVTTPASTQPTSESASSSSSTSSSDTSESTRTSSSTSQEPSSPSETSTSTKPTSSTSSTSSSTTSPSSSSSTSSSTSSTSTRTSSSPSSTDAAEGASPTDVVAPTPEPTSSDRSRTDEPGSPTQGSAAGTPESSGEASTGDTGTGDETGHAARAAADGGRPSTR
jgi:serine/threonine-protein kinase